MRNKYRQIQVWFKKGLYFLRRTIVNQHNPLIESILFVLLGIILFVILVAFHLGEFGELAHFLIVIVLQGVLLYFFRVNKHNQSILMEITTSYLIHGEKPYIDTLLGKLISGNWKQEEIIPGDALFTVLKEYSLGDDYELKRRIAESLPALCEINESKGFELLSILRNDWDLVKWKDDNRRRSIESLTTTVSNRRLPILIKYPQNKIFEILSLKDDDQIFTALAISDAFFDWKLDAKKKTFDLIDNAEFQLCQSAMAIYSDEEYNALKKNIELNNAFLYSTTDEIFNKLKGLTKDENYFNRIVATRNILVLSDKKQELTLRLINEILINEENRYVRRPLAKERVVLFLINQMSSKKQKILAKEVFENLTKDKDFIIRITTFDLMEVLMTKSEHQEFVQGICNGILLTETDDNLIQRAKRLLELLKDS